QRLKRAIIGEQSLECWVMGTWLDWCCRHLSNDSPGRRGSLVVLTRFVQGALACCLLASGASACSDDTELPLPSAPAPSSTGVEPAELQFSPCDIVTEQGSQPNQAECAQVEVPLRRDASEGRRLNLSLKRYRRTAQPRGQLWLIAGGPGSAASDFEVDSNFYLSLGQDLELYFLDHRGAGRSERLSCPQQENSSSAFGQVIRGEEWSSCSNTVQAQWGADLAGFSTTEAAFDLGEIIARAQREDEPVFIYSVSYGTYLTQRYLQLFPQQASGIILDSICAPGNCDLLIELDRQSDRIGQAIFSACADDAICSGALGADPWQRLIDVARSLSSGHCSSIGWSAVTLRQVLGMMVTTAGLRDYMPAVVRRIERCSDIDVAALNHFRDYMSGIDTEANSFSQVLHANIVLSELGTRPLPTTADVERNVSERFVSMDAGVRLAGALGTWPTYAPDRYVGSLADTSVPMLMLHGTLDPQIPIESARAVGQAYRAAHQQFVEMPFSAHDTLMQSLLDEDGNTCGAELVRQFLKDPLSSLDDSCTSRVLKLNFAGHPVISTLLFGTEEAWY
ncbi:MAG TPA: alpha/beta fold hydrolase, partial [Polyangiaceae bacterium]|nr:alpha/beta fold hydrolase [Polyangiaceae bacterium]